MNEINNLLQDLKDSGIKVEIDILGNGESIKYERYNGGHLIITGDIQMYTLEKVFEKMEKLFSELRIKENMVNRNFKQGE
jgi:hypothetical protein